MRAGPAAVSAFLLAALAMPAPRATAQCAAGAAQAPQARERLVAGGGIAPGAAAGGATAQNTTTPNTTTPNTTAQSTTATARISPGPILPAGAARSPAGHAAETQSAQAGPPLTLAWPDPYRPYQARPPGAAPLRSDEVAASLRARGFVDVSAVRQRGRSFLAEATGPRGERVRLVLDADSGEINGMQVIGFRPIAP